MRNKRNILIGCVALIIIAIVGVGYTLTRSNNARPDYSLESASGRKVEKTTNSETEKSSGTATDEAIDTLETKKQASPEEKTEVAKYLEEGMKVLNSSEVSSNVKNDDSSHLANSTQELLKVAVLALKVGYKYDSNSLVVYTSKNTGVLQFVFNMTKDGADNISFAGNYVQSTRQIELANQHGTIEGVASPDNKEQYKE